MEYNGYIGYTHFSDEDNLFIGKVMNCDDILVCDGDTEEECEASLIKVIDDYIKDSKLSKKEKK